MANIHPAAVVGSKVQLGVDVEVGPFSIIEDGAIIGDRCRIAGHAVIKSSVTMGADNVVHEGAVIGGGPQHTRAPAVQGRVQIGSGNSFRENSTVHCGLTEEKVTILGDGNYLMVNAHVGHDSHVGSQTILANNSMLGGHVVVEDFAFVSGGVAVHQFCRIGTMAMVGGQAHVVQDVPPYVTVDGLTSRVVGLNRIGLKRRGVSETDIRQLKDAYTIIFRSGLLWSEALAELRRQFTGGPAAHLHEFLAESRRGFIHERRTPRSAAVRLPAPAPSDSETEIRKVG